MKSKSLSFKNFIMILGYINEEGVGKNPKTLTEALKSKEITTLIEQEDAIYPEWWLEVYKHKTNHLYNQYQHYELPYRNYIKLIEVIEYLTQLSPEDKLFKPEKLDVTFPTTLTLESIKLLDFDYIVDEKGNKYISRKLENLPLIPSVLPNTIQFKCRGKKSKLNVVKETLTTTYIPETDVFEFEEFKTSNFRGTILRYWSKKWNLYNFAEIITNHPYFSEICCINETTTTIKETGFKVMVIALFSGTETFFTVQYSSGILKLRIQNCSCVKEYELIACFADKLLDYYESIEEEVEIQVDKLLSILRIHDPNLFIKNYSRESLILPIPLTDLNTSRPYIEYPLGSNKYYTAPDSYYPGLKKNRLENKDEYPYIVTCYKSNHLNKPTKLTYQYYHNSIVEKEKKAITLKECLSEKLLVINATPYTDVLLQEFYNQKVDLNTEKEELLYRYYEEMYHVNIIIIPLNKPKCPEPYFWKVNPKRETIVVFQKKVKNKSTFRLLNLSQEEVNMYIEEKSRFSVSYETPDCQKQMIDFWGKRRMVQINNEWIESIGAPLNIETVPTFHPLLKKSEDLRNLVLDSIGITEKEPTGTQRHYIFKNNL